MGGRNEQVNVRSKNQSGDWSIPKVKVQITYQSSSKCMISEPHPGTPSTNKIDSNDGRCCLCTNFIIMAIHLRTTNVYPYDTSYEPMYIVSIVIGASTYIDRNTGILFIIVINEAL